MMEIIDSIQNISQLEDMLTIVPKDLHGALISNISQGQLRQIISNDVQFLFVADKLENRTDECILRLLKMNAAGDFIQSIEKLSELLSILSKREEGEMLCEKFINNMISKKALKIIFTHVSDLVSMIRLLHTVFGNSITDVSQSFFAKFTDDHIKGLICDVCEFKKFYAGLSYRDDIDVLLEKDHVLSLLRNPNDLKEVLSFIRKDEISNFLNYVGSTHLQKLIKSYDDFSLIFSCMRSQLNADLSIKLLTAVMGDSITKHVQTYYTPLGSPFKGKMFFGAYPLKPKEDKQQCTSQMKLHI